MVDVGGEHLVRGELLAPPGERAADDEALVQAHQVADEGALQQVVADGDARCAHPGLEHRVVDEGRIHDDVAVVGQKQIGAAGFELVQPRVGDAVGRAFDGAVEVELDALLQCIHRMDAGELTVQAPRDERLEQPTQTAGEARKAKPRKNLQKLPVGKQPGHDGRDFGVSVWSDGFEFVHHALCKGNNEYPYLLRGETRRRL